MSKNLKLDKADLDRIKEENGIEPEKKKKKPVPVKKIILWSILTIIGIAYVVVLAFGTLFIPANIEFFQSFNIFSQDNPYPHARLLSYAILIIVAGSLIRAIFSLILSNDKLSKRMGKAVLGLLSNLVKYLMVIAIICLGLSALGVDATAILAGLGIVTLIIGLGVTSLIEDIVAGIFIIAENLFDVDDIIVLDGFRGTVVSVGIRSTKIADVGGSILTVRNSQISKTINLTDRQSCAAITLPLAPGESIQKVEEVLKIANIESISKKSDKVKMGPLYLGACGITRKGVQELLFIAGCLEQDIYEVERLLYRELAVIFEDNGIKLGALGADIDE